MGKLAAKGPPANSARSGGANGQGAKWTAAMNNRRCKLIDKEIAGNLTSLEAEELNRLQQQMLNYRRQIAPLPLHDVRQLHDSLLKKAAAAKKK